MRSWHALLRDLKRAGVQTERRRNNHWVIFTPRGKVFIAGTPSDTRAEKNVRALLRKKGVYI